jgi:hypothetical protein
MCSLTLISKGEKKVRFPLFPSMPKGEIVGMFYRQRILFIDGKYNNYDGLSTGRMCQVGTRSILGRHSRASSIRSKEIVLSMRVCH